jgi:hypothetical protein
MTVTETSLISRASLIRYLGLTFARRDYIYLADSICEQCLSLKVEPRSQKSRINTDFAHRYGKRPLHLRHWRIPYVLLLRGAYGVNLWSTILEYTCFANTLFRLVRLRGPVRSASTPDHLPDGRPINAPREIMRLVNWMMSNGPTVSGGHGEINESC